MMYLWLPIGLAFPTLIGWLLLRLVEGSTPVLYQYERWVAGFVLGCILSTFLIFLSDVSGIGNFSMLSMLLVQGITILILGSIYAVKRPTLPTPDNRLPITVSPWQKGALLTLGVWIGIKLVAGSLFLVAPGYFDDVLSNWNLRGKAFFVAQELVLELEPGKVSGVSSYPQSIPLTKTWLASLHGDWHEGLVNMPHMLWYIAALALLFFALRRITDVRIALLGTYGLASIPLYTMHGMVAYGDCLLSTILFLAISWLFFAAKANGAERMSFFKLGAVATALLVYTKNEALLLHLPPIALLLICTLVLCTMTMKERRNVLLWYGCAVAAILLPWLAFKFGHSLTFGNAKGITGLNIEWHEGVLTTIFVNTFLEGNWSLLPGLFVGLVAVRWKHMLHSALIIPTAFFFMVWLGQLPIYMFTNLYIEAVNQTGYGRGIIHLIPIVVLVTTVLLATFIQHRQQD